MRSAVIILTVLIAVAAEAPYHLPRPTHHAPPFVYPSGPGPLPPPPLSPAPFPQLPQPRPSPQPFAPFPQPALAPQPSYTHSPGYNYQQPNFGSAFVHPAPQYVPQLISVSNSPSSVHLPAPRPQPLPIAYPQPIPINYPQPQPLPVSRPHPQLNTIPQSSYGLPQPHSHPQLQLHSHLQPLPNYFHNAPQAPQTPAVPIAPLPAFTFPQPISYTNQHPISQPQFAAALPLQSQPLTNSALSSYQADSNQYATGQEQIHGEVLDQTVVSRLQNIIKDDEHSSAKNAGYLSLVSGVSLESAKPSIEISSFVQNSPQTDAGFVDIRSASSAAQSSSSVGASVSSSYAAPNISSSSSQSNDSSASIRFLPNNNPGISYGVPN